MLKREVILNLILIVFLLCLQQLELSYSVQIGFNSNIRMNFFHVLLNLMIVSIPFSIAVVLSRNIKKSIIFNTLLITIMSLLNYHVLVYHGSPFLAGDILSATTAMNVIGEYKPVWDSIVMKIGVLFLLQLTAIFLYDRFANKTRTNRWRIKGKHALAVCTVNIGLILVVFFSSVSPFKANLVSWTWAEAMNEYGYGICLCNSIATFNDAIFKPESFNAKEIVVEVSDKNNSFTAKPLPDIVLILNESLCDIDTYSNIPESKALFSRMKQIEGLVAGSAISSMTGGGTNNSEYELLTSNSMSLFSLSAPFTVLNMNDANSLVSYLEDLNYTTTGMHCGIASNYARNRAYEDMGFDSILLGEEAFNHYSENGKRPWTDYDNYLDMIDAYEQEDKRPRFMYLLTLQNHGGYEQNGSKEDPVCINADLGDLTDDVNEYLSSVKLSLEAFEMLVRYYEKTDRDVILFMMGDHAPSFISQLPSRTELTESETELAQKTVPYYVWTNSDYDLSAFTQYISMVDAGPLILDAAEMPLTGYYKTILELHKEIPVRTNTGLYIDANGSIGKVADNDEYQRKVQNYHSLEYINIKKEDYNSSWYELGN